MSLGKIRVELDLDDKGYSVRMREAGKVTKEFRETLQRTADSVKGIEKNVGGFVPKLRDIFITASIAKGGLVNLYHATVGWQMKLIQTNAEIERSIFLLRGMSNATSEAGRSKEAADGLNFLLDAAERSPFALSELTNSFVKFKSVGLDPMDGSLRALTDAVASFGGNDQILHRATIAIQQMAGKGVISMEELRQQLGEAVPSAITLMARSVGMSYQELVDKISKGQVEAQSALARMFDEMDRSMGGSGERMMETWTGLMSVMRTRWIKFQMAIGENHYFDKVKGILADLVDSFDENRILQMANIVSQVLNTFVNGVMRITEFVYQYREEIWNVVKAIGIFIAAKKAWLLLNNQVAPAFRMMSSIMGSVALQTRLAAMESGKLTVAMRAQAVAAGANIATKGRLAAAVGALGGPIGILIGVLGMAGAAWLSFGNKGNEALNKVRDGGKLFDRESFAEAQSGIREFAIELSQAKARLAELEGGQGRFLAGLFSGSWQAEAAQTKRDIAAMERDLAQSSKNLAEQRAEWQQRDIDAQVNRYMRGLTRQADGARAHYNETMKIAADAFAAGEITQKEYDERRKAAAQDLYGAQLTILNENLEATKRAVTTAHGEQKLRLETQLNALYEQIRETEQKAAESMERVINPTTLLDSVVGGAKGRDLDAYLRNIATRTEEFSATLNGGSSELAKFNYLLQDGAFGKAGVALLGEPEQLERARQMILTMEKQREAVKAAADAMKLQERAVAEFDKVAEDAAHEAELLRQVLDSSGDLAFDSKLASLEAKFTRMAQHLPDVKNGIVSVKEAVDGLMSGIKTKEGLAWAESLGEKTRQVRASMLTERQQLQDNYNHEIKLLDVKMEMYALAGEDRKRMEAEVYAYQQALAEKHARDMEHPIMKLARTWEDAAGRMAEASSGWVDDMSSKLADFVVTGKASFADFAESVIQDMIRIRIQEAMSQIIGSMFGGSSFGNASAAASGSAYGTSAYSEQSMMLAAQERFATGGIMTAYGRAPLRAYASGGIANSPQLALFGEGSRPEAYVPLPDGKTIPVTMRGGGAGNVQVNVINQSGQDVTADQGEPRFDGERMVLDVVLKAVSRPGGFRDSMKNALG